MHTVTINDLLQNDVDPVIGRVIYVVHEQSLVFYVGQSKRDILIRFREHVQKPSRLGQLIALNRPQSLAWQVTFYTLDDCRPYIAQQSLFPMQAWQHFDMDMAESAMIRHFCPVINRDFNPRPTPLPAHYRGHALLQQPRAPETTPQQRLWLNRMQLHGWTYEQNVDGAVIWRHRSGKTLSDAQIAPFRRAGRVPPAAD